MKKIIGLLVMHCLLAAVLTAHPAVNGWESFRLKGKVKTYSEHCDGGVKYFFDRNGFLMRSEGADWEGNDFSSVYSYSYDNSGRIVKMVQKHTEGGTSEDMIIYNALGTIISVIKYLDGELQSVEYWNEQQLLDVISFFGPNGELDGTRCNKYDDRGFRTETSYYNAAGLLTETTKYVNDQHGNPIKITSTGEYDSEYEIHFEYDEMGNPLDSNEPIYRSYSYYD